MEQGTPENTDQTTDNTEEATSDSPSKKPDLRMVYLMLVTLMIIVVIAVISTRTVTQKPNEQNTIHKLGLLGGAQWAYQSLINQKNYGSLNALKSFGFLSPGASASNLIRGYSLTWDHHDAGPAEEYGIGSTFIMGNSFTIVSYPQVRRLRPLRTFWIIEDQRVRVFNPENGNEYNAPDDPRVSSWDIIPNEGPSPTELYEQYLRESEEYQRILEYYRERE